MMQKCLNDRYLIVTDIESVDKELDENWTPFVVLLTAWSIEAVKAEGLSELIKSLLAKGAKEFVCIGSYSESLHDEIDNVIYEYDEERNISAASSILTSYQYDESVDDSVDYFVYGTVFPEAKIGGLLALIGDNDQDVEACLKKA